MREKISLNSSDYTKIMTRIMIPHVIEKRNDESAGQSRDMTIGFTCTSLTVSFRVLALDSVPFRSAPDIWRIKFGDLVKFAKLSSNTVLRNIYT